MNKISTRPVVVLSGINLIDGGALSVYYDCLDYLIDLGYTESYEIIALVGKKEIFDRYMSKIRLVEFPDSKKSWLKRVYYEYFYFKKFSKTINVYIWISLHDITPNVVAQRQYVYCHNPSPFNRMRLSEAKYGWKYYLFSKFYKYLYKINIKKNAAVIVQQDWIRQEFLKMFKINNVIVARPSIPEVSEINDKSDKNNCIFVYPSFPRYYKNFEVLCEATKLLVKSGINDFRVYITLDGTENAYSKELVDKYKDNFNICFTGLLKREDLYDLYGKANCLIFMSKLETWGMPIIEFKKTGKPIIVSDLAYAYETIGNYSKVEFVEPDDAISLADKMKIVMEHGKLSFNELKIPSSPFAGNWEELFKLLFRKN